MPPWPSGTIPQTLTITVAGDGIDNPAPPPTEAVLTLTIKDTLWGPVQLKEEAGGALTLSNIFRHAFNKYRRISVKRHVLWVALHYPYAVTILATTHRVIFKLFINDPPTPPLTRWAESLMVGVLAHQPGP
jgi:hypothetical protein